MKKLMWIAGICEEKTRGQIVKLAEKHNEDLKLSSRFLIFPLHVSFKRSFYTEDFDSIKSGLKELMNDRKTIDLGKSHPERVSDMIWICFEKEEEIKMLHRDIDLFLKERYGIMIDPFDEHYKAHMTLFRDDDEGKLDQMFERLNKEWIYDPIKIDTYFIGSKSDENEYFELKG